METAAPPWCHCPGARSPRVSNWVRGGGSNLWPDDLRAQEEEWGFSRTEIYWGAWPWRAWKVKKSLKSTGSQWRDVRTGARCGVLLEPVWRRSKAGASFTCFKARLIFQHRSTSAFRYFCRCTFMQYTVYTMYLCSTWILTGLCFIKLVTYWKHNIWLWVMRSLQLFVNIGSFIIINTTACDIGPANVCW